MIGKKHIIYILLVCIAQTILLPSLANQHRPEHLSSERYIEELVSDLKKVEPFEFVRKEAEKLGVKVWLFGGTAATFAHYVAWDLRRKNGDTRYLDERFDYHFSNIYRSTQDADLVIDGTSEQAEELERIIQSKYPEILGTKTKWEIRLLRHPRQDKSALLDDPQFLNQHSDSNSVGLIQLGSQDKKSIIKDLKSWENPQPPFLMDILRNELHFYYSNKHTTTQRYKDGLNPAIFAVIRYLTKAFQFETEIPNEDREILKKLIQNFSPKKDLKTDYAQRWFEKNAKKLYQNAANLDYAEHTLRELGLLNILTAIGNKDEVGSLSWWMNRKPLSAKPIKKKLFKKTAKDLGITIVAHETRDMIAYESIIQSPQGHPNVFISRNREADEAAIHGDGFYTRKGREGGRQTGITIRFNVHPDAVEGEDFFIPPGTDYVVFLNKNALQVIPESFSMPLDQYLDLLSDQNFAASDKALTERLKRRIILEKENIQNSLPTVIPQIKAYFDKAKNGDYRSADEVRKAKIYVSTFLGIFPINHNIWKQMNITVSDFFEFSQKTYFSYDYLTSPLRDWPFGLGTFLRDIAKSHQDLIKFAKILRPKIYEHYSRGIINENIIEGISLLYSIDPQAQDETIIRQIIFWLLNGESPMTPGWITRDASDYIKFLIRAFGKKISLKEILSLNNLKYGPLLSIDQDIEKSRLFKDRKSLSSEDLDNLENLIRSPFNTGDYESNFLLNGSFSIVLKILAHESTLETKESQRAKLIFKEAIGKFELLVNEFLTSPTMFFKSRRITFDNLFNIAYGNSSLAQEVSKFIISYFNVIFDSTLSDKHRAKSFRSKALQLVHDFCGPTLISTMGLSLIPIDKKKEMLIKCSDYYNIYSKSNSSYITLAAVDLKSRLKTPWKELSQIVNKAVENVLLAYANNLNYKSLAANLLELDDEEVFVHLLRLIYSDSPLSDDLDYRSRFTEQMTEFLDKNKNHPVIIRLYQKIPDFMKLFDELRTLINQQNKSKFGSILQKINIYFKLSSMRRCKDLLQKAGGTNE